jgi:hypothetical protein
MSSWIQSVPQLLQLPDACLQAVLRCCADDPCTLFSAARAHSRLHQAAVLAASSIRVVGRRQEQLDSALVYLANHGQHISSIEVDPDNFSVELRQLPHHKMQALSSLKCSGLVLQLQPLGRSQGVLGPGMPLQQLVINRCILSDNGYMLGAALATLPGLLHLSISFFECMYIFPSEALQELQQLTYLELVNFGMSDRGGMRHLQGLTRLQDLRLQVCSAININSSMLSGSQQLTRFELCEEIKDPEEAVVCTAFHPDVLAGMPLGHGSGWGWECLCLGTQAYMS